MDVKILKSSLLEKRNQRFNTLRNRIKFGYTQHGWNRLLERLSISQQECIDDVSAHLNECHRRKGKQAGKYLVIGEKANYILSDHGDIITVLTKDMDDLSNFRKNKAKNPMFHGVPKSSQFKFPNHNKPQKLRSDPDTWQKDVGQLNTSS